MTSGLLTRRLAVFDCDGTLVDGQANIHRACDAAFAAEGRPAPSLGAVRRIIGLSLVEAMRALAPDADDATHRRLTDAYRHAFFTARTAGALDPEPLFDGIADVLAALAAEDWLLGIATGKSDRGLAALLAHHGLADRFVTLQTADRHPSKPDPTMLVAALTEAEVAPADAVMIGDTSYDMMMAGAAGVRAVGVAWGYHAPEELVEAGAAAIADHARDLPALLLA